MPKDIMPIYTCLFTLLAPEQTCLFTLLPYNRHDFLQTWLFTLLPNYSSALMSFQLSTKCEGHNSLKKTAMPLGSSKWKWAWRAHFLSHTYETQEICCFLADVKIILLSFFYLSYCLKVAKSSEAFLSRCSELFALTDSFLVYLANIVWKEMAL